MGMAKDEFEKREFTMEFTLTALDWAKIAAGLRITVDVMRDMEAQKGPMPPQVRTSAEALIRLSDDISLKMMEYELKQGS
jgi:hypothetical protein